MAVVLNSKAFLDFITNPANESYQDESGAKFFKEMISKQHSIVMMIDILQEHNTIVQNKSYRPVCIVAPDGRVELITENVTYPLKAVFPEGTLDMGDINREIKKIIILDLLPEILDPQIRDRIFGKDSETKWKNRLNSSNCIQWILKDFSLLSCSTKEFINRNWNMIPQSFFLVGFADAILFLDNMLDIKKLKAWYQSELKKKNIIYSVTKEIQAVISAVEDMEMLKKIIGPDPQKSRDTYDQIKKNLPANARKFRVFYSGNNGETFETDANNNYAWHLTGGENAPFWLGLNVPVYQNGTTTLLSQKEKDILISTGHSLLIPWNRIQKITHSKKVIFEKK